MNTVIFLERAPLNFLLVLLFNIRRCILQEYEFNTALNQSPFLEAKALVALAREIWVFKWIPTLLLPYICYKYAQVSCILSFGLTEYYSNQNRLRL